MPIQSHPLQRVNCFTNFLPFFHSSISGSPAFITQKNERSLKYEATKPVYVRPKSSKPRVNSSSHGHSSNLSRSNSHPGLTAQTDVIHASTVPMSNPESHIATSNIHEKFLEFQATSKDENGMPNVEDASGDYISDRKVDDRSFDNEEAGLPPKSAISVRVKSAYTRRPAHIDEFAEEERKMKLLEEDFKKTAVGLQKKLGIEEKGTVFLDF